MKSSDKLIFFMKKTCFKITVFFLFLIAFSVLIIVDPFDTIKVITWKPKSGQNEKI